MPDPGTIEMHPNRVAPSPPAASSEGAAHHSYVAAVPAPLMVLGSIVSIQVGSAIASGLIREVGSVVTVGIRLAVAALVMLVLARPLVRGKRRTDWLVVLALGASLAATNLCFYGALGRLPLGVVVTVEFLGPLGLAAALSRTPAHLAAVLLALAGVVAVSGALQGGLASVETVGLLLAAGAGVGWAVSILATRAVGARWRQLDGLAIALAIGAVIVAPAAAASWDSAAVTLGVIGAGAVVDGSVLFDGAWIGAGAVISDSVIGRDARVGERTVLRDVVIGDRVRLGAHVELTSGARVWPDVVLADNSVRFSSDG